MIPYIQGCSLYIPYLMKTDPETPCIPPDLFCFRKIYTEKGGSLLWENISKI